MLALACGEARPRARRLPDGSRLIQKKEYQALYGPAGRLERVMHDSDGDQVIDRWEALRPESTVAVSASSRNGSGRPDVWRRAGPDGFVHQSDFDDDRDGQVDRTEYAER